MILVLLEVVLYDTRRRYCNISLCGNGIDGFIGTYVCQSGVWHVVGG